MVKNVGNADRIIRALVGVAALVGGVAVGVASIPGGLLLVVGGVFVVTAAVGFCPLYRVLGLRTVRASESER